MPVPLAATADVLLADMPRVLAEWTAIAADEPWLSLPPEHRLDSLPLVVPDLVRAALGAVDFEDGRRRLIAAGVKHGRDRRRQAFAYELLFTEYYLLREAMWRRVQELVPPDQQARVITHVDHAITVAQRASLLGYHRDELEAAGRWDTAMDALACEVTTL